MNFRDGDGDDGDHSTEFRMEYKAIKLRWRREM